jgi:hypothetical protein
LSKLIPHLTPSEIILAKSFGSDQALTPIILGVSALLSAKTQGQIPKKFRRER